LKEYRTGKNDIAHLCTGNLNVMAGTVVMDGPELLEQVQLYTKAR
jgi:hypothetical protein